MHEMGGFDVQKARQIFNVPEDYEVGIMIAIGYKAHIHNIVMDINTHCYPLLVGSNHKERCCY
jgi:hypothetical protein